MTSTDETGSGIFLDADKLPELQSLFQQASNQEIGWEPVYQFVNDNMPNGYSDEAKFWFEGAIGVNQIGREDLTWSAYFIRSFYSNASILGYDIDPQTFRVASDIIASGVISSILDKGGEMPTLKNIIKNDALAGTAALGLPKHLWAGVIMAQVKLGQETFAGPEALPETVGQSLEASLMTVIALGMSAGKIMELGGEGCLYS